MQKNILFYTDSPIYGGAERQIVLLAKFLDSKKYSVSLACSKQNEELMRELEKINKKVFRLNVAHKHDPRHFFHLKKIIHSNNIALLHAHVWNPASCRYAYLAAKSCKIPLIITEHDPGKISILKTIIKKWLIKNVSAVIAVSHENAKLLAELYPDLKDKITVIHNGIDIAEFESRLKEKQKFDKKTILCVAELHPRKGLKYLIEAFNKIDDDNLQLIIAGDGSEKRKLKQMKSNVILLGKRDDVPQLMAASDLFVLPSLHEAFGLVLLEAMIAKLPIISTNSGGVPEIIEHGKNGLLVPPANSDALAEAIKTLLNSPELNKKFIQNGLEKVYKNFRAETMAEKTAEVYDKFL